MDDSTPLTSPADAEARRLRAFDRLRDRVEKATREIERLRGENAELNARVRELAELEAAGGDADAVGIAFDEDPEALRAKIEGFIGAIDRLLDEPAAESSASS